MTGRGLFGEPPTFDPVRRQYAPDVQTGDLFGRACGGCGFALPFRRDKCDPDRLCGNEKRAICASLVPELRYMRVTIHTPACQDFAQRPPDENDE